MLILGATRVLFAMSRDGLLPERIAQTNKKIGIPVLSTIIVVLTGILLSGFLSIGELAEFANIGGLTAFALNTICYCSSLHTTRSTTSV